VLDREDANKETNKETADQAAAIAKQFHTNSYVCAICLDSVGRKAPVWTCGRCFIIVHRACISQWKESKQKAGTDRWNCVGCNNPNDGPVPAYTCFCGAVEDPEPSPYRLPHTCEGVCGRSRGCPHPCSLPCHPGRCPPCPSLGPLLVCACGSTSLQTRCVELDRTDSNPQPPCTRVCDQPLACGLHRCMRLCHHGPCGPCAETNVQTCFCGDRTESRGCGTGTRVNGDGKVAAANIANPSASVADGDGKEPTSEGAGMGGLQFSCGADCGKLLACGLHVCMASCHAGPCAGCQRQPSNPQRCACGKEERCFMSSHSPPLSLH
jgi:transcriptional repressor NF-X1